LPILPHSAADSQPLHAAPAVGAHLHDALRMPWRCGDSGAGRMYGCARPSGAADALAVSRACIGSRWTVL